MASADFNYDHPNYTIIRQESHTTPVGELGSAAYKPSLTFRSKVAAVVTQITATTGGSTVLSTTVILTLLHNGSVAAVLTLEESLNTTTGVFTLTANRTLTAMTDRLEISTNTTFSADAAITVVYEYRVVPGSTFSLFAAIS